MYVCFICFSQKCINTARPTPFLLVCEKGHLDCLAFLHDIQVDNGVKLDVYAPGGKTKMTSIQVACYKKNVNIVEYLLDKIYDKNNKQDRTFVLSKNSVGSTALHYCAMFGDLDSIEHIKAFYGSKWTDDYLNQQDNDGYTPFHFACEKNHHKCCDLNYL